MTVTEKYKSAERVNRNIKLLEECEGWSGFLHPYIALEMERANKAVMMSDTATISEREIERLRGYYQALRGLLDHIEAHKRVSASVIGKGELKVFSADRG